MKATDVMTVLDNLCDSNLSPIPMEVVFDKLAAKHKDVPELVNKLIRDAFIETVANAALKSDMTTRPLQVKSGMIFIMGYFLGQKDCHEDGVLEEFIRYSQDF